MPHPFLEHQFRGLQEVLIHFGLWDDYMAMARDSAWLRVCILGCQDPLWALQERFKTIPNHREEKRQCLLDIAMTLREGDGRFSTPRLELLKLASAVRTLAEGAP